MDAKSVAPLQGRSGRSLLVVTRVHNIFSPRFPCVGKLRSFIDSCEAYADHILVCVGSSSEEEAMNFIELAREALTTEAPKEPNQDAITARSNVSLLHVHPWGNFTAALNAGIYYAQQHEFRRIAFQVRKYLKTVNLVRSFCTGEHLTPIPCATKYALHL